MLRFFNQLYRAGLLDPNSMTQTYDEMSQKVKNGGVFWGIFNYASSMVYNTDKHLGEGKMMYARVPDEANPIVYGLSTLGGNRIWSVGSGGVSGTVPCDSGLLRDPRRLDDHVVRPARSDVGL